MTARELLIELESLGVVLAVRGDKLTVDAPRGALSKDLLRRLSEHKPELMELVSEASPQSIPSAEEIAAMSLDEFAKAGLIVRVYSGGLGCHVLFVSDDVDESEFSDQDLPVFRAHEMRKLASHPPTLAALRTLTEVKRVFGAEANLTEIRSLAEEPPETPDANLEATT